MKKKFLVIRFSSIGDIVLTTPVVRLLKLQQNNAEVHFLTKQKFRGLLEENLYIDKIYSFEKKLQEIMPALKAEQYDYIIDLHRNLRSLTVKKSLGVKAFTFRKLNIDKWLLVNLKIDEMPCLHIVDRYLETLESFGIQNDNQGLDYFIPKAATFNIIQLPDKFQNGYVAIVLGGTFFTKRLPAKKYFSLVRNQQYNFVLLGGNTEKKMATEIMSVASDNVVDLCGKLSIHQSASVVEQARLVIANDTGLMHIAAAFRKKILSVWGNTVPELGMYPYLPANESKILEVKNLKCRPCSKLGKHQCPKKHFNCMNQISESEIINWVKENYSSE